MIAARKGQTKREALLPNRKSENSRDTRKGYIMEFKFSQMIIYVAVMGLYILGCAVGSLPESNPQDEAEEIVEENMEEIMAEKMILQIGDSAFTATLESNTAVDALVEMMNDAPVTIQMRDYSGFEKVGSLGTSLETDDSRTTTRAGDIVLYNGNQIVVFYGSNSWSYTRLGKIDDLSGWEDALGSGDVTVTFSLG